MKKWDQKNRKIRKRWFGQRLSVDSYESVIIFKLKNDHPLIFL